MVGTGRFELPTPRTPSECSTRLSHVPTLCGSAGALLRGNVILHHDEATGGGVHGGNCGARKASAGYSFADYFCSVGGTYSLGSCAPGPKKYCSICWTMKSWWSFFQG